MHYCPACERPVRELTGTCPHCGKPLGAAGPSVPPAASTPVPAPRPPSAVPAPRRPSAPVSPRPSAPVPVRPSAPAAPARSAPPPPEEPAGEEPGLSLADDGPAVPAAKQPAIDWEHEGQDDPELDLAFDPGAPPVPVRTSGRSKAPAGAAGAVGGFVSEGEPEPLPPEEVERVAGFAKPGNYALAPLYAFRALRRLGPLKAELAARRQEEARAVRLRREAYAEWARAHGRELVAQPALKAAVEAVLQANQALHGFLATRQADFERFRQADGALAEQTAAAEAEKGKLAAELATRELALRERGDGLARSKAKLRRAEIEWRNLERLAQGNVGPGSPHAARAAELQQARAAASGEVSQAEAEERAARQETERLRGRMDEIDRQLEARREQLRSDPARRRLEDDHDARRRAVEDALVQGTTQALARKVLPAESPEARRLRALDAAEEVATHTRQLHEAALEGVDRTMLAVGVALPVAALVLLVVLLSVLR